VAGRPVACPAPKASIPVLGLELAGLSLFFKPDHAGIISIFKRRYGRFSGRGSRGYTFSVSAAAGRQTPFKPSVVLEGSRLELARGDFRAVLDMGRRSGELRAAPNEQCLDAFLRSLTSFFLNRAGGFMLHSAGLVKDGKAYIFLGKSGAGKSTLSKLAASRPGVELISDEINLLRREKGRWRVHGSPFWGEMRADGRPGSWPLGGILLMSKFPEHRIKPCTVPEALRLLLRCSVNFEAGPGTSERALSAAAALLAGAEFRRLYFSKKDNSFLELV